MGAILTPRVMRRIAGECTDVDECGAVGIRLEAAAAMDENQDGTRDSKSHCSSEESVSRDNPPGQVEEPGFRTAVGVMTSGLSVAERVRQSHSARAIVGQTRGAQRAARELA